MSDKQAVIEAVSRMPDTLTLAEIRAELELLSKLREAEADIEAGRLVPHEEIKRQYREWLTK
jgi:predicted transcriptional regulator